MYYVHPTGHPVQAECCHLLDLSTYLCLEGVLPGGEVDVPLLLLLSLGRLLTLGQPTTDGTGLLVSKVEGNVLGVLRLVHFSDILPLLEVDDGEDTGDGLADGVDLGQLGSGTTSDLLNSEGEELSLQLAELLEKIGLVLALQLEGPNFVGHLDGTLPLIVGRG